MTTSTTLSMARPLDGALLALGLILPASALAENFVVENLNDSAPRASTTPRGHDSEGPHARAASPPISGRYGRRKKEERS